jgi:hypothetical protein
MSVEKLFDDLFNKYGDEFNWMTVPLSNNSYNKQAEKEIKYGHSLYGRKLIAVAKCESNDDVLYFTENNGETLYIILHLTYSENQDTSYPKYILFNNLCEAEKYLEKQYIEEYL